MDGEIIIYEINEDGTVKKARWGKVDEIVSYPETKVQKPEWIVFPAFDFSTQKWRETGTEEMLNPPEKLTDIEILQNQIDELQADNKIFKEDIITLKEDIKMLKEANKIKKEEVAD
ncbi:hypothetical protein ACN6J9_08120 [Carnobacterium maltaromaticum]|uniref:hypothetical protein n=1 Tax=Carnobacterium maltaromaticum TaxID=2751 RepID=UPI003AFA0FBC